MNPNRILLFLTLCLGIFLPGQAKDSKPDKAERDKWEQQMRQYKTDFICHELQLTPEQKEKFKPLYEEMDQQIQALGEQVRATSRALRKKGDAATDAEYDRLAREEFELRGKENRVEMSYFPKFRSILTSRQLFRLKGAERKFMRQLMEHREKGMNAGSRSGKGRGKGRQAPTACVFSDSVGR